MNAVVYLLHPSTCILSTREAVLSSIPFGLQQAILTWIDAKNRGELSNPASLLARTEFVSDNCMLVRRDGPNQESIVFSGKAVGDEEMLVFDTFKTQPLPTMPHARSFYLSNGKTITSLTLPFVDEMSVFAVVFEVS